MVVALAHAGLIGRRTRRCGWRSSVEAQTSNAPLRSGALRSRGRSRAIRVPDTAGTHGEQRGLDRGSAKSRTPLRRRLGAVIDS